MTPNTVPGILDAVLDPLTAVQKQVLAALVLARRNKLPGPFIDTIHAMLTTLADTWATLNETATALDPARAKDQL